MGIAVVRRAAALALVMCCAVASGESRASLLLDFAGGTEIHFVGGPSSSGWEFSVASPVLVNGLAYFDIGSDGFAQSHPVGLWTSGGVLLSSTTVTSASPILASASTAGDWRFATIPTLVLAPGNYVVGGEAFATDTDGVILNATSIFLAPGTAFVEDRASGAGTGFAFPTNTSPFADFAFFGPGVLLTSAVPEPGILALLALSLSAIGLMRLRQYRR
jgi:hypothetical protein